MSSVQASARVTSPSWLEIKCGCSGGAPPSYLSSFPFDVSRSLRPIPCADLASLCLALFAAFFRPRNKSGETENHKCVNDLWAFDLGSKRWEEIVTADKAPSPRYGHTAVALAPPSSCSAAPIARTSVPSKWRGALFAFLFTYLFFFFFYGLGRNVSTTCGALTPRRTLGLESPYAPPFALLNCVN